MSPNQKDPPVRLSDAALAEQWFDLMHRLIEKLQSTFRRSGLNQKEIGARIGRSPAFISRCLSGQQNMTIRTIHDIARAMDCRVDIALTPLKDLAPSNRPREKPTDEYAATTTSWQSNTYVQTDQTGSAGRLERIHG